MSDRPIVNPEHQKVAQREAATRMLNVTFDVFDTLVTKFDAYIKRAPADASIENEYAKLTYIQDALAVIVDAESPTITLLPRTTRPDDKVKPFPGEHAGVNIQFVTKDGVTARINFYGGLRDTQHAVDQHDTDRTFRTNHATRTDVIVSHPTHINLHVLSPGQDKPFIDLWMKRTQEKIGLSTVLFEGSRIDVAPQLNADDHMFRKLNRDLGIAMKNLMLLVPNPYSPR